VQIVLGDDDGFGVAFSWTYYNLSSKANVTQSSSMAS
jgi:hypothetical protein